MESAKVNIGNYVSKLADPGWKDQKLKKACKDFESLLTYQLLRSMRKTVDKCDLFHGGQGEEIYQSLFDMQISKSMVEFGPNSLARLLYDQLKGKNGVVTDVPDKAIPSTAGLGKGLEVRRDEMAMRGTKAAMKNTR